MNLTDRLEDCVPVRAAKIGRGPQSSDGICLRPGVVYHNIGSVIGFDVSGKILATQKLVNEAWFSHKLHDITHGMNFDMTINILGFNGREQGSEPLKRPKVATDPEEIHLSQTSLLLGTFTHAVPYATENRGERSHSNASSNKNCDFVFEDVFRCTSERSIDEYARQGFSERRMNIWVWGFWIDPHYRRSPRILFLSPLFEVTAHYSCQSLREITNTSNVDWYIIVFGGTCQSERMILPDRNFRTAEEYIL